MKEWWIKILTRYIYSGLSLYHWKYYLIQYSFKWFKDFRLFLMVNYISNKNIVKFISSQNFIFHMTSDSFVFLIQLYKFFNGLLFPVILNFISLGYFYLLIYLFYFLIFTRILFLKSLSFQIFSGSSYISSILFLNISIYLFLILLPFIKTSS
jgi:hypothetical protein